MAQGINAKVRHIGPGNVWEAYIIGGKTIEVGPYHKVFFWVKYKDQINDKFLRQYRKNK